ncbi:ABC transporter permease [Photobacterium aphoticum]|uniref:ABC transporter permease n=1 Tax=Photobacterium aphoticum TaxID=754436 RepID=A0A0J1GSZ3_9GAMM|nr:ABC transporter permease [Photobacterium aphoticum]KLV02771.1 ABC transporter permease [Photobacterium aphoticum]PSU58096.1 ABC transporter permease [Photobacterium aphoticum]GHA35931.1 ABC transporter permease [Photobacterium aphoticum]
MLSPVAKALWGHYKRHPLQIVLVWFGLTLGIALLVGVLGVNQQARESYRDGEQLFSNPFPYRIRHVQPSLKVPQGFYIQLRRVGFDQCVPLDQLRVVTQDGRDVEIVGVDPISLYSMFKQDPTVSGSTQMQMLSLMQPPYPVLVGEQLANYMNLVDGQHLTLENGKQIGPLKVVPQERISGPRMLADLALLRSLQPGSGLTGILCGDLSVDEQRRLLGQLPMALKLEKQEVAGLEPLTNAFHLNLFAMGMLAFVVGLFIFYQAMSLSFSQRQPLVGLMRQAGVSSFQLAGVLIMELLAWIVLGLIGGNILGLMLAERLLPSVAETLNDLYGANISLAVEWHWEWGVASLLIAIIGSLLACGWPLLRLIKTPPARLATHMSLVRFSGREFALQALFACLFLGAALAVYQLPHGQEEGFVLIACILIASALVMPFLLLQLFNLLGRVVKSARLRWFFSDAGASLSYRGVASMAFMLALASNIGMETMVGSFRTTTETWLDQRLAADIYVRPSINMAPRMSNWLEKQDDVEQVWWQWSKTLATQSGKLQVVSIGGTGDEKQAMAIKVSMPEYWQKLHHGRAILASESLALKQGWKPGDVVDLPPPMNKKWTIAGIYYDYGNPYGQIVLSQKRWQAIWPHKGQVALAIHLADGVDTMAMMQKLGETFRLSPERVRNNNELMHQAMRVFDRTFIVTATLGKLTLFVAVCGLFFATLAGEISRQRQFALLRCMGMTGRELALLGGGQLFLIGLMTALMALPLGLVLAQLLIDVVLKYSFGWTMPVEYFPVDYFVSLGSALAVLLAAGAWPVWRLVKRSAILSLRDSF